MKSNWVLISSSERSELALQVRFWIMQLHICSFGDGGSFSTASHDESSVGQACALLVGLYDAEATPVGFTDTICFEYAVKSASLVALSSLPNVTRPKKVSQTGQPMILKSAANHSHWPPGNTCRVFLPTIPASSYHQTRPRLRRMFEAGWYCTRTRRKKQVRYR